MGLLQRANAQQGNTQQQPISTGGLLSRYRQANPVQPFAPPIVSPPVPEVPPQQPTSFLGKVGNFFTNTAKRAVASDIFGGITGATLPKDFSEAFKMGKERRSKAIESLQDPEKAGDVAIGFSPMGAAGSLLTNSAKAIAASKDVNAISKWLKTLKVPEEKIPNLSTVLTNVEKPKVVEDIIKQAIPTKTPVAKKAGLLNREPKAPKVVPEELQSRLDYAKYNLDNLESTNVPNRVASIEKYLDKTGEFKGELNFNNAKGKFGKEGDTIMREAYSKGRSDMTAEELAQEFYSERKILQEARQYLKDAEAEVKAYKPPVVPKMPIAQPVTTKPVVTSLKKELPVLSKAQKVNKAAEEAKTKAISKTESIVESKLASPSKKIEESVKMLPKNIASKVDSVEDALKASKYKDIKVTLPDYMRSPEKVLKKIGLESESRLIRKSHDNYVKEIAENSKKITNWHKLAPTKESNIKIFKALNGEQVTLTSVEAKVASEIRKWLAEFADRLNLPKEKRITNYITHLFEDSITNKEVDEQLYRITSNKISESVYNPFLKQRTGINGFLEDTWKALDAYSNRASRKVSMDPAFKALTERTGTAFNRKNIDETQFNYIKRYIDGINLKPTELDSLLNSWVSQLLPARAGSRPVTAVLQVLRKLTSAAVLGIKASSGLLNLSQGVNTYAKLGEKYTVIGYSKLFSKGAKEELEDVGILAESFIEDRSHDVAREVIKKADKVLYAMFSATEYINRGAAYFGAKAQALAKGKTEQEAVEYGKKVVRETQFLFGPVDNPVALRNELLKTLLQFQTFTVKQVEFLADMAMNKDVVGLLRYGVAGLAFVNTIGEAFDMDASMLIPSFRFGVPPSLKVVAEAKNVVFNSPDKYGKEIGRLEHSKNLGKAALGLLPGSSQLKKTQEGLASIKEGGVFDKGNKLQYQQDPSTEGKIQSVLFGPKVSKSAQSYYDKPEINKKEEKEIQPFYDDIQKLIKEGRDDEAKVIYDSLGEKGKEVYSRIKNRNRAEKLAVDKKAILPTYQKIQSLIEAGKDDEARAIYDTLDKDQLYAYSLVKKALKEK